MASSSSSAPSPQYRSRFGDTTLTKVFVGGLAWETPTEELHRYFEQFGEILEAVIISDKITGRSKGYGFTASSAALPFPSGCIPYSVRVSPTNRCPIPDPRRHKRPRWALLPYVAYPSGHGYQQVSASLSLIPAHLMNRKG
ncbi:hypothetical protein B296_00028871 [Ensete ventricosum]|uniref:RRM domain-containing protein n=1 Tax=Ensete ventricosum TaxID=4639 RepID=A0A427AM51_ENSVE|nr:hypothetical protein B296_00028871 [Ensete ventricosum]